MKTSFACTLSLVALAGLAGCANPSDEPTPEGASSDIVGVTDLTEMEAALGRAYLAAKEHAGAGATTEMDSATKERLRQLGYIH